MTEQETPNAPAPPRPIPDLGFFAGPSSRRSSAFGGAPVATAPSGPAAGNQFGAAPAVNQFGGPVSPFGGQLAAPAAPPARAGSAFPRSRLVAAGIALALVVLVFFGGRFGWQQVVADPVLPATLGGMAKIEDTSSAPVIQAMQQGMTEELGVGSEAKVALYADGLGARYMLFAVRGGGRPGSDSDGADAFAGWSETRQDGATCWSKPAQAQAGLGVTFCMRGFWRRAVLVMAIGATPPAPATVASLTAEAWKAQ